MWTAKNNPHDMSIITLSKQGGKRIDIFLCQSVMVAISIDNVMNYLSFQSVLIVFHYFFFLTIYML